VTIDSERWDNINWTRDFLCELLTAPRIPRAIRLRAGQLFKHYPEGWWVDEQRKKP
jgi:hypothetical protein